jgi:hypothetical protein
MAGTSLLSTGDIGEGRRHYDKAIALYDPAEHRPLATRFGQDAGVSALSYRSLAPKVLAHSPSLNQTRWDLNISKIQLRIGLLDGPGQSSEALVLARDFKKYSSKFQRLNELL